MQQAFLLEPEFFYSCLAGKETKKEDTRSFYELTCVYLHMHGIVENVSIAAALI